jgi:serine phosphatase RsbU (regulator of sigma subunit)
MIGYKKITTIQMKTLFSFIIILFCFCVKTSALEHVVSITSDKQFYNISPNTYYLVDSTNRLSIEKIINEKCPYIFKLNKQNELHNDHNYLHYWYKINLENKFQSNKNMVFELANSTIPLLRVFIKRKNNIIEYRPTGNSLPFNTRDIEESHFCYQLNLLPFEKVTIYVQIEPQGDALNIPVELYDSIAFASKSNRDSLINGVYYGLMLITLIISFVIIISFTLVNERTNIVFLGILLFFSLWNADLDGLAFQYLWPSNPWISNFCMYTLPLIGIIFLSLFADEIREKKFLLIVLYNIKMIFSLIIVFYIIYTLCFELNLAYIHSISILLGTIMLLLTFISWYVQIKYQPRTAKYYISLLLSIVAWVVIISLKTFTNLFTSEFYTFSFKLFLGTQAIILTFAVISKMRIKYTEDYYHTIFSLDQLAQDNKLQLESKLKEISSINKNMTITSMLLEKRNKELQVMSDEIQIAKNYAKNIQQAFQPNSAALKKTLKQVFTFYKPKYELSSDTYFVVQIEDDLFVAVIDCSSNGMAGTLLLTMVTKFLETIIYEKGITATDTIVQMLQSNINQLFTLNNNSFFTFDSIDIAMISIQCKTNTLSYSGTKIPALIVNSKGITELKGDTNSLGENSQREYNFTKNSVLLQKGDVVYIFTNGYANQFNNKSIRFMKKNVKKILSQIHSESANVQKHELEKNFYDWKGDTEQTDDVLIVGIKI